MILLFNGLVVKVGGMIEMVNLVDEVLIFVWLFGLNFDGFMLGYCFDGVFKD